MHDRSVNPCVPLTGRPSFMLMCPLAAQLKEHTVAIIIGFFPVFLTSFRLESHSQWIISESCEQSSLRGCIYMYNTNEIRISLSQ